MKKSAGFHLIELLIALSIVCFLSVFGISQYSHHLVKERRLVAISTLNRLALSIEKFYIMHNTYEGLSLASLGFKAKIVDNHYQLKIALATMSEFRIEASPLNQQKDKDSVCGTLILNSAGQQAITGTGTLSECW